MRVSSAGPGIGCKACAWLATQDSCRSRYARFSVQAVKFANFLRHARSRQRLEALSAYNKHLVDQQNDTVPGVPSDDDFLTVWKALGSSSTGSMAKVAKQSARKTTTLEWCLWEALRDSERVALAQASTIALAVDERKGRLLLSFTACAPKGIDVTTGFLAQLQHQGANSVEVAACVRKAVRRLCTRRRPHPGINRLRTKPALVLQAERRILKRIEFFTADGAANEQLALRLLHPTSERTSKVDKLPGLKLILRDKAHASRRLTQRTFQADPLLKQLMEALLFSKNSIAKLLRFSGAFADIFAGEVQRQSRDGSSVGDVRNLSFAKQRFDSTAKPLGRCVWHLDALISTCHIVRDTQGMRTDAGRACNHFLNLLDAQAVVLLGMLADASDECLVLTRFFDEGIFELGNMSVELLCFKQRINALFGQAEACLQTGFTSLALKRWEKPKMLRTSNGQYKSIGGLPPVDIIRIARSECLPRLRA